MKNKAKNRLYLNLASLLFGSSLLVSCGNYSNLLSSTSQAQQLQDLGDVKITYAKAQDQNHQEIRQLLKQTGEFDEVAKEINDNLILPTDISVSFQECDEENAFYDPDTVEIIMCYELIQKYTEIFTDGEELSEEEYIDEVIYASLFTFYHELGHALIDQLNLPITGREEDAVDEFASIILLEIGDSDAVLAGALQFDVDAEEEELNELPYWDEHSLSYQRFEQTLCLLYGSNPQEYSFLAKDEDLPEDITEDCKFEYQRKSNTWLTLLSPYLKN